MEIAATMIDRLTEAQKGALTKFEPGCKRKPYPDVNPRTVSALWSLGLLKGEVVQGNRLFILTELGEEIRNEVMRCSDYL